MRLRTKAKTKSDKTDRRRVQVCPNCQGTGYGTGRRVQQVLSVHVNSINPETGAVSLTGHMPNGTPRYVTLLPGDDINFEVDIDIDVSPDTLTWR